MAFSLKGSVNSHPPRRRSSPVAAGRGCWSPRQQSRAPSHLTAGGAAAGPCTACRGNPGNQNDADAERGLDDRVMEMTIKQSLSWYLGEDGKGLAELVLLQP